MRFPGFVLIWLFLALPALAVRVSVIDGDTLWIDGAPVRLWGIDAPENGQPCALNGKTYDCGLYAAAMLESLIDGNPVHCRKVSTDRYGRTVARCAVNDLDLGRVMVLSGWAVDYQRYSGAYYRHDQRRAQAARRGLWAGEFRTPWKWRRDKRERKDPVYR